MPEHSETKRSEPHTVTVEEVNRVLDVGRLLLSVLTSEELGWLANVTQSQSADKPVAPRVISYVDK